jgi:hypothetical protein
MDWIDKLDDEQLTNLEMVFAAADKYKIPANLLAGLAYRESKLRSNAMSEKDEKGNYAYGPMQLRMPAATDMKVDRQNVQQNIDGGARYFKQQLDKFGDPSIALLAYHAGPNHEIVMKDVPIPDNYKQYVKDIEKHSGLDFNNPLPSPSAGAANASGTPPGDANSSGAGAGGSGDLGTEYSGASTLAGVIGAGVGATAAPVVGEAADWNRARQDAAEKLKYETAMKLRNDALAARDALYTPVEKYSISQGHELRGAETYEDSYKQERGTRQGAKRVDPTTGRTMQPTFRFAKKPILEHPADTITVPPMPNAPTPQPNGLFNKAVRGSARVGLGGFGGGMAGVQGSDALERAERGDTLGAALAATSSGTGALTAMPMGPKARALTALTSLGAAGAKHGLDYLREQQQPGVTNKADGGLINLQGGGSPKRQLAGKAVDTAAGLIGRQPSGLFVPRETQIMRMSEALAPHEGKYLGLTQSDNYGVHGGRMGGNQFPNFQNINPLHRQERAAWMTDAEGAAKNLVENRKHKGKDVIFSTYIGAHDQLKSNKSVTNDILNEHYKRELTPEQIALINNRIATVKDSKGKLIFPQAFDIRDRFATQELGTDTFGRRGALADIIGAGVGVNKTRGGIALPHYEDLLRSHRDPLTEGVPTSSIGTRLFSVHGDAPEFREDLHPDYRWLVRGEDQGVQFAPVPQRLGAYDWYENINSKAPGRTHGNAWFSYLGNPQFIDEKHLTRLQKEGYAEGGLTHLQSGGTPKKQALRYFVDPVTKHLSDWNWKGMPEVSSKLNLREVPDYIQGGYGDFMKEQAKRAAAGDLTARDLIKAYTITQSSIGRGGLSHATASKAGLKIPNTGNEVRPEGAFAEWLGSPSGQKYLDMAARGEVDPKTLAEIQQQFAPFGKQNDLIQKMQYAAETMPGVAKDLNQAIVGDKDAYRKWAEQMKGVAGAKSGFIGSMLGRGDLPTFDARQITLHTGNQAPVGIGSIMNRGKGQGGREAVDRLAARQEALGLDIDPSLDPFYQHLTHHAVWDKVGDNKTTHDDLVKAMRNYAEGGLAHLQAGGSPKKEIITRLGTHAYDMLGLTPEKVAAWKSANIKPNKQQQDPVLAKAVEAYLNKQISQADYLRIMNERRPIRPLTAVPAGHTNEDIVSALLGPQVEKGILGLNAHVPEGTRVGNRLDIPAYERYGIYVDTMHDPAGKKPIAYGHTGHLKDVQFSSSPTRSARIGLGTREQELTPMAKTEGTGKSPFAMMVGNQVNTSDEEVRRMLKEYLRDPEWHQIGMNPYRASQFYDKSDMRPVWSAKEKLQAGPLVLARDIEKSDWTDPRLMTDFGVNYKEGGLTGLYANIHAKRERIKHGSGEKMRKPGSPGAPTADAFDESAKTAKLKDGGTPSLSVGRGEKLSVDQGAGLTAKGRAKYNRETGSNLKAPQPEGGARKDSFCARMQGVVDHAKGDAPRAKASLKRWNC